MKLLDSLKVIKYQAFIIFAAVFFLVLLYGVFLEHQRTKPLAAVLMFHSVDPEGPKAREEDALIITPDRLEQDLKYLKLKGYNFIDYKQLQNIFKESPQVNSGANKNIMVTFDDGYRNNYDYAYPVLKQESVKALISIIVYYLEKRDPAIPDHFLTWDQINEMEKSGLVEFASHSYNSHHYIELDMPGLMKFVKKDGPMLYGRKKKNGVVESYEDYITRLKTDFEKAKTFIMKRTGKEPEVIAFPYGKASVEARKIAGEFGFKIQMGVKSGIVDSEDDFLDVKRIAVKNSYSPEELEERIKFYTGARIVLP